MPNKTQYQVTTRAPVGGAGTDYTFAIATLSWWRLPPIRAKNHAALDSSGPSPTPPGGEAPAVNEFVPNSWFNTRYRKLTRAPVSVSGGTLGGDWSDAPPLLPLSQPLRGLKRQKYNFGVHVVTPDVPPVELFGYLQPLAIPRRIVRKNTLDFSQRGLEFLSPVTLPGEFLRPLSEPKPHRTGLHAYNVPAFFETVQLIPDVPFFEPSTWFRPLASPAPRRPGLRVDAQRALNMGVVWNTGPAVTAGTWFRPLSERKHVQYRTLRSAMMPRPFVPPFVPPPPPPVGGARKRRRFVRRGRVY